MIPLNPQFSHSFILVLQFPTPILVPPYTLKCTQTRTSVRGAFNLYFIAAATSVFQSGDSPLFFLQPQGLDHPSVGAQITNSLHIIVQAFYHFI